MARFGALLEEWHAPRSLLSPEFLWPTLVQGLREAAAGMKIGLRRMAQEETARPHDMSAVRARIALAVST